LFTLLLEIWEFLALQLASASQTLAGDGSIFPEKAEKSVFGFRYIFSAVLLHNSLPAVVCTD